MKAKPFEIGTEFTRCGKQYAETVVDVITWTNSSGEIVGRRYVAVHDFCGQRVLDRDVLETTIARAERV